MDYNSRQARNLGRPIYELIAQEGHCAFFGPGVSLRRMAKYPYEIAQEKGAPAELVHKLREASHDPQALLKVCATAEWGAATRLLDSNVQAVVERLRAAHTLYEQMASQTPERLEVVAKALGATAEQIEGLCKVDDTRNATIELVLSLRGALEEMRLGALRKRLKSLGASAAQLDNLDDAEDPQASATELAVALAMSLARR
eukprot:COSAG04_NODE_8422_length_978_cov_0.820250_1_plen_200_part_10